MLRSDWLKTRAFREDFANIRLFFWKEQYLILYELLIKFKFSAGPGRAGPLRFKIFAGRAVTARDFSWAGPRIYKPAAENVWLAVVIYTKNNSSKSLHIQYVTFSLYWETVIVTFYIRHIYNKYIFGYLSSCQSVGG